MPFPPHFLDSADAWSTAVMLSDANTHTNNESSPDFIRKEWEMCLNLHLAPPSLAWSCSGFLPGSLSTVIVAVPTKLGWISASVIWKSPVPTPFLQLLMGLFMCSLPFSLTLGDSVRLSHTRGRTLPRQGLRVGKADRARVKPTQSRGRVQPAGKQIWMIMCFNIRLHNPGSSLAGRCVRYVRINLLGSFFSFSQFLFTLHQALYY